MCPCRTPRKLFDSCIYLKYCSHHQSDLFHVSLARKKERFLRLKGNKVHQQEFLRFHISWPRRNEWLFIWPSALHRDLSEFYTSSGAKVQLVTFQKLYCDNSLFLPQGPLQARKARMFHSGAEKHLSIIKSARWAIEKSAPLILEPACF